MLDKLEIELKKIAKKILNYEVSIDLDEISKDVLTLYEKIILYKYFSTKGSNILNPNEIIKKDEFESSKKSGEKFVKLKTKKEEILNKQVIRKQNNRFEKKNNFLKKDQDEIEHSSLDHPSDLDVGLFPQKITKNLNDQFAGGLQIDLNDKNAFIKHLFNENKTIYQQIIKEIESLNHFEQVKKVIGRAKKYHNNWEGKESYEKRFIYLLQKNFL